MAVMEAIETVYLEVDSITSVAFTSIPATYEHLQLRISSRDLYGTTYDWIFLRFNSDSGTNYSSHAMEGYSSSTNGVEETGKTYARLGVAVGSHANVPTATYSTNVIDILDYANTNKNTTMMGLGGNALGAQSVRPSSALWGDTDAVNRIDVYVLYTAAWERGTEMTLYGLKSA